MKERIYERIEHTADIGIRIFGENKLALFTNACKALVDILVEERYLSTWTQAEKKTRHIIEQQALDIESLLNLWLSEVLYLSSVKGQIPVEIDILELDDLHIKASLVTQRIERYQRRMEIKAVTYHNLKIEKTEQGYLAEVIFDV